MYRYPLTSPHYGLMPTHIFSSSSSSELDTVSNVGYRSDESGTTVDINDVGEELNKTLQLSFEVGDTVFVRPFCTNDDTRWYQGVVRKVVPTDTVYAKRRHCRYVVVFRRNLKATFDPVEGNMKPSSSKYQGLLHKWRRYFGENSVTYSN